MFPGAWAFLERFRWDGADPPTNWEATRTLIGARREFAKSRVARFGPLLARWDDLLADIGGDPSRADWAAFRPLRLHREEDWSDWLAHLLESSSTGGLAACLFDRTPAEAIRPAVVRELPIEHRRLDIRITWAAGDMTHVEVKVGDLALEKTFETAELHRESEGRARVDDWILLPPDHVKKWEEVRAGRVGGIEVGRLTWDDVAIALRRSLAGRAEDVSWRVWARAFCGAIEQQVLGVPRIDDPDEIDDPADLMTAMRLMERSLDVR